jgi:uncharacterized protein YndB with AHSA1/START domain
VQRSIHITRFLPHSPERVWRCLTEAELLGKWFMANNINAVQGAEFTFTMAPQKGWDGVTHCRITTLEPFHKIAYTYRGEASGEKPIACAGVDSAAADKAGKHLFLTLDTVLYFTLTPEGNGTRLDMTHSGYKGLKLVIVSLVMGMGWKKQMKKLEALLSAGV